MAKHHREREVINELQFDPLGPGWDIGNRLQVSTPYTVYDIKQNTSSQPLFYDESEVSGGGTSFSYNTYKASSTLAVSANTAGKRVQQTKTWTQYQPGKAQTINISANFKGAVDGVIKRLGMFNEQFGLFFEVTGDGLYVVIRTYNTGAAVDTRIHSSEFNIDNLDGIGPSNVVLDLNYMQLFVIDYEWLGVDTVRFGFKFNGKKYWVHKAVYTNTQSEVYMTNPNAPIRFEISNDGTGAAAELISGCVSVHADGGLEQNTITTYVSRDGSPITLANQDLMTPVLSVRLKATRPCTRINIGDVSVLLTTNTNFEWAVFLSPTIAGSDAASWQNIDNSALQYDISRTNANTVSGGYKVDGGYGASTNQTRMAVGEIVKSFLTIGSYINGSLDEYVLAVKNIDGNGGTCYGGMTLSEYC